MVWFGSEDDPLSFSALIELKAGDSMFQGDSKTSNMTFLFVILNNVDINQNGPLVVFPNLEGTR